MVKTEEYLLQALEDVIKMERDGREFYLAAAGKVKNDRVRETLKYLAEAEKFHIEKFKEIYQSLQNDPAWTEAMAAFEPLCREANVFVMAKIKDGPDTYRYDLEALESALKLEERSFERYTELAQEATNPLARRFFTLIADEERDHYITIQNLQNFLEMALGSGHTPSIVE